MRRPLLLLAALLAGLAVLPPAADARRGACVVAQGGAGCQVWYGTVKFVGDGDTVYVDVARDGTERTRKVRLSGIQTMEMTAYSTRHRAGDCHAVEATDRLEALVRRGRGRVRLSAQDPGSMSRGRLLRTIAVKRPGGWRDIGATMLTEGLALWWPTLAESAPNRIYSQQTQAAIAARRGLFDPAACGAGPSAASPLKLWVNWDADGDDLANPSGEWVKIRNLDTVNAVPLGGWYLRDSGLRRYTFRTGAVIEPGATITVDVGRDGDGVTRFAWGLRDPVFENASDDARAMGDGAYLFDTLGNIRANMVYPCRLACTDPLQGALTLAADPEGRTEHVDITNRGAGPADLDGYVLKSAPQSYHFQPGSVIPPGATLRIRTTGQPDDDEPLARAWGFAKPILRNAGDVVALQTYTGITLACTAWGDRSC